MSNATLQLNIKTVSDFSDVQSNVQNIQQYLNKLKLPTNLKSNFANMFGDLEKEMARYQKFLDSGFKTKGDITGFEKSGDRISSIIDRIQKEMVKISPDILNQAFSGINTSEIKEAEQKVTSLGQQLRNFASQATMKDAEGQIISLNSAIEKTLSTMGSGKGLEKFRQAFQSGDINQMEAALKKLDAAKNKFKKEESKDSYTKGLASLKIILDQLKSDPTFENLTAESNQAKASLTTLQQTNLTKLNDVFAQATSDVQNMNQQFRESHSELVQTESAAQGLGSELDMMKSRVSYFFGLTNSVMLFRRALQKAFETVKELDAVMTEMAVVTDLEVGDYWTQLPEFSKNARDLGVSIKGAYEATTLYLQQGLAMAQAQEVANETLKMARIAGMEAAEATDMMTSALRGFNMEINENSAQRINDVYSELAAITASNTQEIATAMTKTASIAASANMEFETTSALLAQIIETTREAPETAGTALKTVIARFQELKKAPSEIGEVDGEIIDANKIEGALRSIGVALRGVDGQFRDLDDVFLEIASKWQGLDTNTQRYIATIAAGSRQQSRFIAMMTDYDRTMELVNAANNSAGASQEQFTKTLDSLETKINQLSVAWETFLMGVADNTAIKLGIDLLTGLLETINKILNGLSGEKGLIKSILSLGLVFGGLAIAKNIFNKLFASIGSAFLGGGKVAGTSFITSLGSTLSKGSSKIKAVFTKNFWFGGGPQVKELPFIIEQEERLHLLQQQQVKDQIQLEATTLNLKKAYTHLGMSELQVADIQAGKISGDKVAIILSNEKARAALLEASAKGAVEKETYEQLYAEALLNNHQKMGLLTKAKVYASLLFGIGMKNKDTAATLGLTVAEVGETAAKGGATAAQWLYNAALSACPIGWIVAGIGLLIGALVLYDKFTENAAEKTERLNKELEAAEEASSLAKESYDNLLSSLDQYNEVQNTFSELTVGTKEWNSALQEANNQVLELLRTYPELANFIERQEDGRLIISQEGQDFIINKQRQSMISAAGMEAGAKIALADDEYKRLEKENITSQFISFEAEVGRMLQENAIDPTSGGRFQELLGEYKLALYDNNIEEINRLEKEIKNNQHYQRVSNSLEARRKNDLELDNSIKRQEIENAEKTNKIAQDLNNEVASALFIALENSASEELQGSGYVNILKNFFSDKVNPNDIVDEIDKRAGQIDLKGEELAQRYLDVTGLEKLPENLLEDKSIRRALASAEYFKEFSQDMNSFYLETAKKNINQQKNIYNILKKSGVGLSKNVADTYHKFLIDAFTTGDLSALSNYLKEETGFTFDELSKALEVSYGDLLTMLSDNTKIAIENFNKGVEQLKRNDIDIKWLSSLAIDTSSFKMLSDNLYNIFLDSGTEGANAIISALSDGVKNMDEATKQMFINVLNGIDWNDIDSIKGLSNKLEELGITFGEIDDEIDLLEQSIIELGEASRSIKFEEVKEGLKTLESIAEDLSSGESNKTYSTEEANELIKAGADRKDFIMTGIEEWKYIGDTNNLLAIIKGHTGDILTAVRSQAQARIEKTEEAIGAEVSINNRKDELLTDFGYRHRALSDDRTKRGTAASLADKYLGSTENWAIEQILSWFKEYGDVFSGKSENFSNFNLLDYSKAFGFNGWYSDWYNSEEKKAPEAVLRAAAESLGLNLDDEGREYQNWDSYSVEDLTRLLSRFYEENIQNYEQDIETRSTLGGGTNGVGLDDSSDRQWEYVNNTPLYKVITAAVNDDVDAQGALKALAQEAGLSEEAINDFGDSWVELGKAIEDERIIKSLGKIATSITDITDNYDELSKITDEDLNKIGYLLGFTDMNDEVRKLISNNLALIERAMSGDRASWDTLISNEIFERMLRTSSGFDLSQLSDYTYMYATGNYTGEADPRKDKDKSTENTFDKNYDLLQDINVEMRKREQYQRKYNKLLENGEATGEKLYELSQKEIESLNKQKKLQEELLRIKQADFDNMIETNPYSLYVGLDKDGSINIDWKGLEELASTDADTYEAVKEFIEELEDTQEEIADIEGTISDIEDDVAEIESRGKDAYINLENRVLDALIARDEKIIENQREINDSINEAANDMVKAVQSNINKLRQDRKNEKTEQSIADKERRLAYLRQDTSGANAMEIKQLEEEIAQEKEDYGDSLVDQALQDLQDQNDKAAEQRDRQIELMESQLQANKDNGYYVAEAEKVLQDALANDGLLDENSEFYKLLYSTEGWNTKAKSELLDIIDQLRQDLAQAFEYDSNQFDPNVDYMAEAQAVYGEAIKDGTITEEEENILEDLNRKRNAKIRSNPNSEYRELSFTDFIAFLQGDPNVKVKKYKTGGLADFTGPAWLDGTKTHPEMVLNAQDTENFILLKDVLSSLLHLPATADTARGDNYIEVSVQVDEIGSDYDVDQMVERVKQKIYEDGMYRNNNMINLIR